MKTLLNVSALVLSTAMLMPAGHAQGDNDDDPQDAAALAKALAGVKVTLESALGAGASQGKPISAKFEMEDGALQLSVYTEKDGKFFEVIVDQVKGTVAKSEPITEGDDLGDAKEQSAVMAKAKRTLHDAVVKAVASHKGSRATGVVPGVKEGHAVATVRLLTGTSWSSVDEPLD